MRDLLGGKGANIAEMTRIGGPVRVRDGFTITTEACVAYMRAATVLPGGPRGAGRPRRSARLEEQTGKRLGDPDDPLLVSVRSGARESMPGMMDTVLNLGLNDRSVEGLIASARRTSASAGTPTAGSCRCSGTSCAASTASCSRTRSRSEKGRKGVGARHGPRRRGPAAT